MLKKCGHPCAKLNWFRIRLHENEANCFGHLFLCSNDVSCSEMLRVENAVFLNLFKWHPICKELTLVSWKAQWSLSRLLFAWTDTVVCKHIVASRFQHLLSCLHSRRTQVEVSGHAIWTNKWSCCFPSTLLMTARETWLAYSSSLSQMTFSFSLTLCKQCMHQVLQRLLVNKLKADKCGFHVPTVMFLDYIIADEKLETDLARVTAVTDWAWSGV